MRFSGDVRKLLDIGENWKKQLKEHVILSLTLKTENKIDTQKINREKKNIQRYAVSSWDHLSAVFSKRHFPMSTTSGQQMLPFLVPPNPR